MTRKSAAILALLALTLMTAHAAAHTPTIAATKKFSTDYQNLPYKYGATGYPSWLQTVYTASLQTNWVANNNSRGPRFSYSSTGSGTAWYVSGTSFDCFGTAGWFGCSQFLGGTTWNIWIRSDPGAAGVTYCELNGNATGCRLVKRAVLHEAVGVTLQGAHTHDFQANSGGLTVMGCQPDSCTNPNLGWNATTLLECDQAAFQIKYGLQQTTGGYGGCLDHLAGAVVGQGLQLVQTLSDTSGSACAGHPISISGRIATETNSAYEKLSNVALASRTLQIDRKLHSSSTWTTSWSNITTTTAPTGYNWTRSFTESPTTPTYYDYRLRNGAEPGLAFSTSSVITLLFLNPCPP